MERRIYSVRDSKSGVYNEPRCSTTHGEAERAFKINVDAQDSMWGKFPEDFDLYYLGTYDDVTGTIKPLASPEHVVKAVNVKG